MHDAEYNWSKEAAEILKRRGWRMKRFEKQGVISFGAVSTATEHTVAGAAFRNARHAFMAACYRALQAIGHAHWRLCPYSFPA